MERIGERRKPIAHRVVFTAGLMALAGAVPARRSVKLAGTSFALVLALMSALWLAPFAGAVPAGCPDNNPACQSDIPGVPDNPDTGGPGDTGDVISDPAEPLDPVTDPIEETTDPVADPIEETTDPVLEDPTEPLDPVLGDGGWGLPDTGKILNPDPGDLKDPTPTKPVDGVKDVGKTVEKIGSIENPTGAIDSGAGTFERVGPVRTEDKPHDDRGPSGDKAAADAVAKSPAVAGFSEARSLSGGSAGSGSALSAALATDADGIQPSLFDRVGDVSVEVAKKLAFPLALLLLVAGFLLIHNRIDRKDPKLAHAPVSAENDSLTFE